MAESAPPDQRVCEPEPGSTLGVRQEKFLSHDLDETRGYIGGRFGDRSRVPRARGDFFYAHVVAESAHAAVGMAKTLLPQTLRAEVRVPTLFLPLHGTDHYRIGRRGLIADPQTAVLLAPGHDYTCDSQPNRWIGLSVSCELLSEQLAALRRGRSRTWRFKSIAIALSGSRKAELLRLHRRMRALSLTPAPHAHADVVAAERDVAAWLAGRIIEQSGEVRVADRTQQRIERLEHWIDANLGEPITLDRLSAVAGIHGRGLQKSLRTLRGQSPLEWVTARRLAAVRARLLSSSTGVSVSQVALDFGFTHLGRFSALYRQAFGELPSATRSLAQSQQGRRARRSE